MKVSELFDKDKFNSALKRVTGYGDLVGSKFEGGITDTLVSDIGEPGKIFDGGMIYFDTMELYLNGGKYRKVYMPSKNFDIVCLEGMEIQDLYWQPQDDGSKPDSLIRLDIERIGRLHITGNTKFIVNSIESSMVDVGEVVVYGKDGMCNYLYHGDIQQIPVVTYDKSCKYFKNLYLDIDNYGDIVKLIGKRRAEDAGITPNTLGSLIVLNKDEAIVSCTSARAGVSGDTKKFKVRPKDIDEQILKECYISRIAMHFGIKRVNLEYFGISLERTNEGEFIVQSI